MGAMREKKDLFWFLFGFWPNGEWRGRKLFTKRFWRHREYIFSDTFGRHWNRIVWCRVVGHRKVFNASDPGEPQRIYCPCCMMEIKR